MALRWVQCPYCKESHDIHRQGLPIKINQKTGEKEGKMHIITNKVVKCGFCGKTFRTEEPTFEEALGKDGYNDTSF